MNVDGEQSGIRRTAEGSDRGRRQPSAPKKVRRKIWRHQFVKARGEPAVETTSRCHSCGVQVRPSSRRCSNCYVAIGAASRAPAPLRAAPTASAVASLVLPVIGQLALAPSTEVEPDSE